MSMLGLKTLRDTMAHKGQFIALIVLVALGIMSFVTFRNGYYDLRASVEEAYGRLRFAHFTVRVDRMPLSTAEAIERLDGVEAARVRTIQDVGIEFEGGGRQATARIITVPDEPESRVNGVYVEAGRYPAADARTEVLLHPKFSQETGIGVNDALTLRIGGERRVVRVVGIASDPEYLYPLRTAGDIPSPGEFAVVFVTEGVAESLLGTSNYGNDLAVRVAPGASVDELIESVEHDLRPYGVIDSVPRAEQPSYDGLKSELDQNRVMARTLPVLVLLISSMSLFIALSRLVTAQRGEIGLAKALGYSDTQILLHYLSFALVVAGGGIVLGIAFGLLGARGVALSYTSILGIPFLESGVYPEVLLVAAGIAVVSCVAAALVPALNSARLAPAVAMHSDPNKTLSAGRIPLIERAMGPLLPRSFTFRIPLRNLFRARRRTLYTVLGIAFAMVLSVVTVSMFDSIDYLLEETFSRVERWDVAAYFDRPVGEARIAEVRRLAGVERAQPALVLPVTVRFGETEENVSLTAMRPDADFHGFSPAAGAPPADALRAGDLILAASTARKLGVGTGSRVEVDSPLTDDPVRMRVGALSDETLGQPGFVSLDAATDLVGGQISRYNALYLTADPKRGDRIQDEIYDLPDVASVQVKAGLVTRLKGLLELFNVFGTVLLVFGGALAFVVVFTTFSANVAERTREIATMRTIGEDNGRLTLMITLENLLIAIAALPLGLWLGVRATDAIFSSFETESYTLSAYIYPASVLRICLLMVGVLLLSEIPPVRRIFRLDLAEATKVME